MSRELQYLHLHASHPPKIGIENYNINSLPILTMCMDGICANKSIFDSMYNRIIGVGLKKKWSPIELNGRIVLLTIIQ